MKMPSGGMSLWQIDAAAVAIMAAAIAGVFFLAVQPTRRAAAAQQAAMAELEPAKALRDQKVAALSQAQARLASVLAVLEANPLRLESISRVNQRLSGITELAAEAGLALDQLTPGQQTRDEDAVVMAIRITGRSTFPGAVAFLGRLHNRFPDTAVTGFRLSGNIDAPEAPAVFEFNLSWFAAGEGAAPGREAAVPLP